jgi:hypothetical protein
MLQVQAAALQGATSGSSREAFQPQQQQQQQQQMPLRLF